MAPMLPEALALDEVDRLRLALARAHIETAVANRQTLQAQIDHALARSAELEQRIRELTNALARDLVLLKVKYQLGPSDDLNVESGEILRVKGDAMQIDLVGVIEEGGERGPNVPTNPRTLMQFAAGTDVTIRVRVMRSSGVAVDLTLAGTQLLLTARKRPLDTPLFQLTGVVRAAQGSDIGEYYVPSALTKGREPGRYVYDVVLVQGGKTDKVIPLSPIVLEP